MPLFRHTQKLWLFTLVVRHGSFGRAAEEASLTKSALSQHLTALEVALGYKLLERRRSGPALTAAGRSLYARVAPILASIESLEPEPAAAAPGGHTPARVRIGAYESAAISFVAPMLARLAVTHPGLHFELRTGRSPDLQRLMDDGALDIALLDDATSEDDDALRIARDRLGVFRARGASADGWRSSKRCSVATLSPSRSGYADYFERFHAFQRERFAAHGVRLDISVVSDSFESLRALAASGSMLAVLPLHVANRNAGDLVEVEVSDATPPHQRGAHKLYLASGASTDARVLDVVRLAFAAS